MGNCLESTFTGRNQCAVAVAAAHDQLTKQTSSTINGRAGDHYTPPHHHDQVIIMKSDEDHHAHQDHGGSFKFNGSTSTSNYDHNKTSTGLIRVKLVVSRKELERLLMEEHYNCGHGDGDHDHQISSTRSGTARMRVGSFQSMEDLIILMMSNIQNNNNNAAAAEATGRRRSVLHQLLIHHHQEAAGNLYWKPSLDTIMESPPNSSLP